MKIRDIVGFDWDTANREKNWLKHKVAWAESEQAFFNEPLLIDPDINHSSQEKRFHALGRTNDGRLLFISFTIRANSIRIISARPMSRLERKTYEENF
ncbi:MAG: BrnT family toxin [Candidatus Uhrbacteria bacterium]|nr:BrnT family toxin [Candidatus Uhrbacteria bacterium]